MKISIITPTLNDGQFLSCNIGSILNQTYKNFEHIIIDGRSTDNTIELLKKYSHLQWISESDEGMYDAINKGIKIANGEICAYLNADDRYLPKTLEYVAGEFEKNPQIDFVFGYCTYISEKEKDICTFRTLPIISSFSKSARITFCQPTCFWRRDVHDRIGLFENKLKLAGDCDFFYRMLNSGMKGKLIPKPLSKFMVRKDCISQNSAIDLSIEYNKIMNAYIPTNFGYKYYLNEILFYLINLDTYFKYLLHKVRSY